VEADQRHQQCSFALLKPSRSLLWNSVVLDVRLVVDVMLSVGCRRKLTNGVSSFALMGTGAGLTAACLVYGLRSFYQGKTAVSQQMMRARGLAQGNEDKENS